MKRLYILAGLTALLSLTLVSPASAAGPEREAYSFVESDSIDCSQFDPAWQFSDDFVDFVEVRASIYRDASGELARVVEHVEHHSNDVNSVTGFTLHEHNHFTRTFDVAAGTVTYSGAQNVMQRPGIGSVIQYVGHKIYSFDDVELKNAGPSIADDEDFCRAVAPDGARP